MGRGENKAANGLSWSKIDKIDLLGEAYGRYHIKFIFPEFVSYLGERGVMCVGRAGALGQWLAPLPFTLEFGVWFPVSAV